MARRRSFIFKLFIGLVVFLALSVWLVASIDPSHVSSFLQSRISQAFKRPVSLGETSLNLSRGMAFEIRNVAVGTLEENGERLEIPSLFVKLRILPLFTGRLKFAELICQAPRLTFDLGHPKAQKIAAEDKKADRSRELELPFYSLNLAAGSLKIIDSRKTYLKSELVIKNINGQFRLTTKPFRTRISLSGELHQDGNICPWSVKGHVTRPQGTNHWAQSILHLEAGHEKFLPGKLLAKVPFLSALKDGTGNFQTQISVNGSPAGKVAIEIRLTGEKLNLLVDQSQGRRLAINRAQIRAEWTHTPREDIFDNIDITLNEVSLSGNALLKKTAASRHLKVRLTSPTIPLASLIAIYPGPAALSEMEKMNPSGTLQVQSLVYDGPLTAHFLDDFKGLRGRVTLSEGRISLPAEQVIENLGFDLIFTAKELSLQKGRLSYAGIPCDFRGTAAIHPGADTELHFEAESPLPAAKLMNLPVLSPRKELVLSGTVPTQLLLKGSRKKLTALITGDLTDFTAAIGGVPLKRAAAAGEFRIKATTDLRSWTLEKAHLATDLIRLEGKGRGQWGDDPEYQAELVLQDLDLAQIPRDSKLLQRLQPEGSVSYVHTWRDGGEQPGRNEGVLTLKAASIHFTRILPRLNSINGTVNFAAGRAEFSHVMARLGSSQLLVSGSLERTPKTELRLRVKSPRMLADDLIFPSDRAYLYNLDGTLTIDKAGLSFDEIHVSLEKGTTATVSGRIKFGRKPETRLRIYSKNAVIDEVIDLWEKPSKSQKPAPRKKEEDAILVIDAEVEKGSIYGFNFQQAKGQIRLKDDTLVIRPLNFHAGLGYGTGQVLIVDEPEQPPLLKISGHLEHFDAEEVSRELMHYGHLVTGNLRGDFYLEGRAGKTFLPTSRGEFNVEINDGVLKKFSALAKIFSILNVSQLFSLKLPDMASGGMPFQRAAGTVHLDQGQLNSENIRVDSHAMNLSVVGHMDLEKKKVDAVVGVKPLGTVDKILTHIPIAGWILTGEDKALVTAYFEIKGDIGDPEVKAVPMTSISKKARGIFTRIFGLPEKMITETRDLFKEKNEPGQAAPAAPTP